MHRPLLHCGFFRWALGFCVSIIYEHIDDPLLDEIFAFLAFAGIAYIADFLGDPEAQLLSCVSRGLLVLSSLITCYVNTM